MGVKKLGVGGGVKAPPLPAARPAWLKSTREWWATVWASPMASVYLDADVPTLVRLARLLDADGRGMSDGPMRAEIRQLEDRFGLSPLARRRLQWEVDQAAQAARAPKAVTKATRHDKLRVVLDDQTG